MNPEALKELLDRVREGGLSVQAAAERLAVLPFEQLEDATVDHHRQLRCGFPEVIFCQGKTVAQVVEVAVAIAARGQTVLGTRADPEQARAMAAALDGTDYDATARTLIVRRDPAPPLGGPVLVIAAGTADLPVAREAFNTAAVLGCDVEPLTDVGVAGLHRLLSSQAAVRRAAVCIVVAGMEGALPSVVGGLTDRPVIAVPTSVGYGASFGGIAALLGMLTSCASGVTVVNIDNGFGAAYAAARILRQARPTDDT